jgi:hypothetical protein
MTIGVEQALQLECAGGSFVLNPTPRRGRSMLSSLRPTLGDAHLAPDRWSLHDERCVADVS